ncbi:MULTISPECIES: hypothetical protein [Treponema]|jgi:transcriptional regulator|uniref:Uncharacterized protein n=1 Tax=Treponema saccharophilum DSM 2985 TaxID=907348 RepID=H7ENT2_9SPIR|nr:MULTISPECIES: hypothetical protein [Treponema]EIC00565.1 hypothetical protein TresaDRAFT_0038 [Treponema saccharophilum DSM 2985]BDC95653.1 hypothetical protein TRSA_07520 [Treponema saccharophilum]
MEQNVNSKEKKVACDSEKFRKCIKMMRQLVSDIQGAPYPGDDFEPELYKIWYEHVQKAAGECFRYLDLNFPLEKSDFSKTLDNLFDK